jgi:hypothetical protein
LDRNPNSPSWRARLEYPKFYLVPQLHFRRTE